MLDFLITNNLAPTFNKSLHIHKNTNRCFQKRCYKLIVYPFFFFPPQVFFNINKGVKPNNTVRGQTKQNQTKSQKSYQPLRQVNRPETQTKLDRFRQARASRKQDAWKDKIPSARHASLPPRLDRHHLETSPELHHRKPRAQKHRSLHRGQLFSSTLCLHFGELHRSNRELVRQNKALGTTNQTTHSKHQRDPKPIQLTETN